MSKNLRTQHTSTGVESNKCLGKTYLLYHRGDAEWKQNNNFQEALKRLALENEDKVIAIVVDSKGESTPLFNEDNHYIVSDDGKTYAKI